MGKQHPGKKRARPQGAAAQPKKQKKQQQFDASATDEGEDVDFASLGFADALAVGLTFAQLGAHDSACEAYARAVALEPRHFSARCQLADALTEMGDHGAACEHYAAASELEEAATDASLWLRLGMAQAAEDKSDAAIASYEKAKQLAQQQLLVGDAAEDEDARRAYGMALAALAHVQGMERGDVAAAVRVYEDAVAVFPKNANLHFNLATMRLASGDEKRAIADLQRAISLDGEVVEFYEELVALLDDGKEKTAMQKKMEELKQREASKGGEEETKEEEEEEEEEEEDEDEESEDDDEEEDEEEDEEDDE